MRFGGPIFDTSTPEQWVSELLRLGYRAAYCPVTTQDDDSTVRAYLEAAEKANIILAEVGAWSNPVSTDTTIRNTAIGYCQEQLALADRVGARCCVNISGSRGSVWDGPHPDNYTEDTFSLMVDTVREIIDAVKPQRTFYTLETMPCMLPDSVDSYLQLIRAIDRPQFAVHFDAVNLINSPRLYYSNADLIRDFCHRLGPQIRSCHAKDVFLAQEAICHLSETRAGLGGLDYPVLLQELSHLDPDTPLMLEHLATATEYDAAAMYIRQVAQ